jgi:tripartite ATP-independent transporter DctP family solute receptor
MTYSRRDALKLIGATGVAAASGGAAHAQGAAPQYQWRFGHTGAVTSDQHELAKKFAELLAQKTRGAVSVSIHPAGQLGGEADTFQQVRGGALDFCIQGTPGLAALGVKEAMLLDLPYVVTSREQGWKLLNGPFGEWFKETILAKTSVRPVGYLDNGFRQVYNRTRAIQKPADLKGLKLRVLQAPGYVTVYKALGALPTPLAYPEVYPALQQGVIDGGECSPKQMVQDKFMEVAKFYSFTSITYNPVMMFMNDALYKKVSPEIRSALDQAGREALDYQSAVARRMDDEMLVEMKKAGVSVNEPDLKPFIEAVKPSVWNALQADIPDGARNIERLLDALKSA